MNRFASLLASAALLSAAPLAAHADGVNPLTDGYSLSVGNSIMSSTNTSFDGHTLSFTDGTSTWTFVDTSAAPLLSALSITRTCTIVNLSGCDSMIVSASNASAANGLVQAGLFVNASLSAAAQGNVSNITFSQVASLGTGSAVVGVPAANSPVPEPGTLGLLATGLVGAAGALRRRLRA